MSLKNTLERAANEVEKNRLWRAREILCSSISNYGYDRELFRSIADLMLLIGETPEAGKFYLLSVEEPNESELAAIDCFLSRYRKSDYLNLIGLFPPQARVTELSQYPNFLQDRLRSRGAEDNLKLGNSSSKANDTTTGCLFVIALMAFVVLGIFGLFVAFPSLLIW